MSDSSRPHGLQPTRLLRPWYFPGKSPGVGCHCLLRAAVLTPGQMSPGTVTYKETIRDHKELHACAIGINYGPQGTKTPEAQMPLRVGGKSRVLHVFPECKTIKGMNQPSEPPLSPTSGPALTLIPLEGPAHPPWLGEQAREQRKAFFF